MAFLIGTLHWLRGAREGIKLGHWLAQCLGALLISLAGWAVGLPVLGAEEPSITEPQVKAAFILNFARYAEWPAESFAATNSPFVITITGESAVGDELQKVIPGRQVNGRPIVLERLAAGSAPTHGHLLFIPVSEQKRVPILVAGLRGVAMLTVGESDDFLASGGCINLMRRGQKVALEVNVEATDLARIKISSKLLSLAKVINRKTN